MLLRFYLNGRPDDPYEFEADRFYIHTNDNSLKRTIVDTEGEGSIKIYMDINAALSVDYIADRKYVNLIVDYYNA